METEVTWAFRLGRGEGGGGNGGGGELLDFFKKKSVKK